MSKFHHLGVLDFLGVHVRDQNRQNGSHGCSFENFAILRALVTLNLKIFYSKSALRMSKFHHLGVLDFLGVCAHDQKRQNGSHGCSFENFANLRALVTLNLKFFLVKSPSECQNSII